MCRNVDINIYRVYIYIYMIFCKVWIWMLHTSFQKRNILPANDIGVVAQVRWAAPTNKS